MKRKNVFLFVGILALIIVVTDNSTSILKFFYPVKFKDEVFGYSRQYGIDPYLVLAIMKAESSFNPKAVSRRNAKGLMQITDKTGEWAAFEIKLANYKNSDLFNPDTNIHIGCWYLRWLIDNLKDVDLAIAAYNGGIGNVMEWLNDKNLSSTGFILDKIPFKETERYVVKVKNYYYVYKKLYQNQAAIGSCGY
ncbi:MAG TPA: lytic transglycosylase domain-containing protein [Clostridiaceae bacterium]|nr:lytic transglycosylase domain-containing protein [Clostridiaceae bacterium]